MQKVIVIRFEKSRDWIKNSRLLLITHIFHKEPILYQLRLKKKKNIIVQNCGNDWPMTGESCFLKLSFCRGLEKSSSRGCLLGFLIRDCLPGGCHKSAVHLRPRRVTSSRPSSPISTRMPLAGRQHRTAALGADHRASWGTWPRRVRAGLVS